MWPAWRDTSERFMVYEHVRKNSQKSKGLCRVLDNVEVKIGKYTNHNYVRAVTQGVSHYCYV